MNWKIAPLVPGDFLRKFPGYFPSVLQILFNRGIKTQKEIEDFFCPQYQNLHDPFLMSGVGKLVDEVEVILKKKKKIGIFTDFDVDGITGAAIFIETLVNLGFPKKLVFLYIPDREKEGYGINEVGVNFLASHDCKVFVSIDCGISNPKEIMLARKLGMKPIIIDHHQVPKILPKADIIINPLQKNDKYPFKNLAAAGITFKIAQALISKIKNSRYSYSSRNRVDGDEQSVLDLACLATISDCCPLLDENRIFVKYGLAAIQKTKRVGLNEIIRLCRLDKPKISSFDVSFRIAPLLNSASRMDHASTAYNLITTDSIFEAAFLAKKLSGKNRKRQEESRRVFSSVDSRISKYNFLPNIIIEADEDWPLTLAGPVSSKILEKYSRPTIIFSKGHKKSQSSSRSIPGFNMVAAFEKCSQYIERFGGHPLAAGCTVLNENFEKFKTCMNKIAEDYIKNKDLVSVLDIDAELSQNEVSLSFFNEIQKFSPFGMKNQIPKFLMKGLSVEDIRKVGKGKNVFKFLFKIKNSKKFVKGILSKEKNGIKFKEGDVVDSVFELEMDEWNGYKELVLRIIDIKTI